MTCVCARCRTQAPTWPAPGHPDTRLCVNCLGGMVAARLFRWVGTAQGSVDRPDGRWT